MSATSKSLRAGLSDILKDLWLRIGLRGTHYSDRHGKLDALYRVRDPWGMETERERFRFREANRLIDTHIGRVKTILEVGSGEGHQSQELLQICERLYGIDVSARAVQRAKERCRQGTFVVGDIFNCDMLDRGPRFDLIVACEVIYYMKDVRAAIERLSELGRWCFVTYCDTESDRLDHYFRRVARGGRYFQAGSGLQSDVFRYGDTAWTAVWWQNERA